MNILREKLSQIDLKGFVRLKGDKGFNGVNGPPGDDGLDGNKGIKGSY